MRQRERKNATRSRKTAIVSALGAGVIVAAAAGMTIALTRESPEPDGRRVASPAEAGPVARVARRETRPTLDPARFTGQAALAYQVARDIPDVLDQLRCYCNCESAYGHVSLLSCYTDGHGST